MREGSGRRVSEGLQKNGGVLEVEVASGHTDSFQDDL